MELVDQKLAIKKSTHKILLLFVSFPVRHGLGMVAYHAILWSGCSGFELLFDRRSSFVFAFWSLMVWGVGSSVRIASLDRLDWKTARSSSVWLEMVRLIVVVAIRQFSGDGVLDVGVLWNALPTSLIRVGGDHRVFSR